MTDPAHAEPRGDVVVGYDGSPSAVGAVNWATRQAGLLGAPLRLIAAAPFPSFAAGPYAVPLGVNLEAEAKALGKAGQQLALAISPGTDVTVEPVVYGPAKALVDASRDARLVVVGTRGLGGAASALLGSVSSAVISHAHCTVVVVPEPWATHAPQGLVVVGVDGSTSSTAALHFASDYASRTGQSLQVLAAWQPPITPGLLETSWGTPSSGWSESAENQAREQASHASLDALERHPALSVEAQVVKSPAGSALASASRTADLVVVGTRGLGGFERLLLGSVSRAAVHGSECPVAVVRA